MIPLIGFEFSVGDHALLDLNRFQGMIPKQVTVRTKSRDSLSSDSIPISIRAQVLKGRRQPKMVKLKYVNVTTRDSLSLGRVIKLRMFLYDFQMQNSYGRRLGTRQGGSSLEGDESFSDRDSGYPQSANIPAMGKEKPLILNFPQFPALTQLPSWIIIS